jgi:DNA-binding NtrC family response regulator
MLKGDIKMIRGKILLVDDEVVFVNNMSKLLNSRGYDVAVANSGDGAIQALEKGNYDVMVLDLKMPGMDGITTLREMRKLDLFTETLIMTGHGAVDTALEAMKLGAYDYLTKPYEIDELVDRIDAARKKKDVKEQRDMLERNRKVADGRAY